MRRARIRHPGQTPPNPVYYRGLQAWYRWGMGYTLATGVSQWDDQSGNGRHLVQATGAKQPLVQSDRSLLFDGTNDYLQVTFSLPQPVSIYLLGKQVTWALQQGIFDAKTALNMAVLQTDSDLGYITPNIALYAGSYAASEQTAWTLDTNAVVSAVFNGASSALMVNTGVRNTGNAGAGTLDGFTIGALGDGSAAGNIQVREILIYSAAHSNATSTTIIHYLQNIVAG